MSTSPRNVISAGLHTYDHAPDPRESVLGLKARGMRDVQPHGLLRGNYMALTGKQFVNLTSWKKTQLNSNTVAASVVTGVPGGALRLTTDATQHRGMQIEESIDGGTTVVGLYEFDADDGLAGSMVFRFKLSHATDNTLVAGLMTPNGTILSAAQALNVASIVGIYKAAGSATVSGIIRGASTNTLVTIGTAVADTWHTVELIFGKNRTLVGFAFDGGLFDMDTALTNLPADDLWLVPAVAFTTNSATARTLDLSGGFAGGEAF